MSKAISCNSSFLVKGWVRAEGLQTSKVGTPCFPGGRGVDGGSGHTNSFLEGAQRFQLKRHLCAP